MFVDHYGEIKVKNHTTGDTASITIKEIPWLGKEVIESQGWIKNSSGNKIINILN